MSRFHTLTILTAMTALGAGLSFANPVRWWVLGLLLAVYIAIMILGVSILRLGLFVTAACRGDSTQRRVALTFDDGPDPAATPALLEVLSRHEVKAAFFTVGEKTRKYPEIARQVDREGHIIGNHTFGHAWWTNFLFAGALDGEIGRAQEAIRSAIGKVPCYFRPPMGLTNPHLAGALRRQGLSVIGWDIRPFDTSAKDETVIKRVLKKVRNGSIIVLHDRGRAPGDLSRLTDEIVTAIKRRKYTFADLEELTGLKAYRTAGEHNMQEPAVSGHSYSSGTGLKRGGVLPFVAQRLASTAYVRRAIRQQVTLDAFKASPSRRFLCGLGLILFSYILGWPMVGLSAVLSAYFHAPALLILGPVLYGFSHLVWMLGMYLAGRDCIQYANILLGWSVRRGIETLNRRGKRLS